MFFDNSFENLIESFVISAKNFVFLSQLFFYHTVKNTVKNFTKVSEIFDLIWFINVYQQKKAVTNVNSSNEIIPHDQIFIIIIVTTK